MCAHVCACVCVSVSLPLCFVRCLSADCLGFIYSDWKITRNAGKRLPSHISTMFIHTYKHTLSQTYTYQYTIELISGKWTQGLLLHIVRFPPQKTALLSIVQLKLNKMENCLALSSELWNLLGIYQAYMLIWGRYADWTLNIQFFKLGKVFNSNTKHLRGFWQIQNLLKRAVNNLCGTIYSSPVVCVFLEI